MTPKAPRSPAIASGRPGLTPVFRPVLALLVSLAGLAAVLPGPASAAPRTYGIDEDPIRLGDRALAEGRLGDARSRYEEALENGYKPARADFGLAEITVREGAYADAEPLYREALDAAPGSPAEKARIQAGLGLLLLRLDRDLEAEQLFAEAVAADPEQWEAWAGRAQRKLDEKQVDEAERILKRGEGRKGIEKGEDLYRFGMARVHLARGELKEAELSALRALALNPQDPEIAKLAGRIYVAQGTPALAIEAFEKALATPGVVRTAPTLHVLGGLYAGERRWDEARDKYAEAVAIDSTYTPALSDLGHLYHEAGRHEQAARVYLRYVVAEPDDVEALVELAESCVEIHQFPQALEAATAALRLDATRTDARFAFARAGIRAGDADTKARAEATYAELATAKGWKAADHSARAGYLMDQGDLAAARAQFDEALRMDPADPHANYQTGIVAMKQGDIDAAVAHLEVAARGAPEVPAYQLNLGIARLRAGEADGAVTAIQRALELNPELTVARVLLAQAKAAAGQLAAAEKQYDLVLKQDPRHAQALRGKGFCRLHAADYDGAKAAYAVATEVEPGNADAWAGLGLANLGREDWPAADAAFARAEKIDPNNRSLQRGRELLVQAREGNVAQ
jgi:tetratricopeptide (TPR) repeat protein